MSRTRRRATEQSPDEAAVVQAICDALETLSYIVHRIGQRRADLAGTDAGTPDLMVTHKDWPRFVWLGIEVKASADSAVRDEQQELAELGRIAIVCTTDQALRAVWGLETWLWDRRDGENGAREAIFTVLRCRRLRKAVGINITDGMASKEYVRWLRSDDDEEEPTP